MYLKVNEQRALDGRRFMHGAEPVEQGKEGSLYACRVWRFRLLSFAYLQSPFSGFFLYIRY